MNKHSNHSSNNNDSSKIVDLNRGFVLEATDLFCGAGGLSHGFKKAGIKVVAGLDMDPSCRYAYETNNNAKFIEADISTIKGSDILAHHTEGVFRILAGCAPCQPFSTYSQGKSGPEDKRWNLLFEFSRLVEETLPDVVTMENVPRLGKQDVFAKFCEKLESLGYDPKFEVVNCADYGVPQSRKRLVLLASKLGPIELIRPTHQGNHKTVRQAIGGLPSIKAGESDDNDILHCSSALSETNLVRIRSSVPGGTWRDWSESLVAKCHKKDSGKSYPGVYGRMCWDEPSPTLTTLFYGFGNGRFGHPEQDRGLSLREGAILQSFPGDYDFFPKEAQAPKKVIGRLIGNAVPVDLGKAIGQSIRRHFIEVGVRQVLAGRYRMTSY